MDIQHSKFEELHNPITYTKVKEILNIIITPKMKEIGLTNYDGNYTWFSDFNQEGVKHIFHYALLKGASATFSYGNCFDFLPTFGSTGSIINHKTDKSSKLHLFERTEGHKSSFEGEKIYDLTSHWGERFCKESVEALLSKYLPIMVNWWILNSSLLQNLATANYQIENGGVYNINYPNPKYCKAFILAKLGQKEDGKAILNELIDKYRVYVSNFDKFKDSITRRIESI